MPALLTRPFRTSDPDLDADRVQAVANVLANLHQSVGQIPGNVSRGEFRAFIRDRARTTENQVWAPVRVAVRDRGGR